MSEYPRICIKGLIVDLFYVTREYAARLTDGKTHYNIDNPECTNLEAHRSPDINHHFFCFLHLSLRIEQGESNKTKE